MKLLTRESSLEEWELSVVHRTSRDVFRGTKNGESPRPWHHNLKTQAVKAAKL